MNFKAIPKRFLNTQKFVTVMWVMLGCLPSSCLHNSKDICETHFAKIDREIEIAFGKIESLKIKPSRSLASLRTPDSESSSDEVLESESQAKDLKWTLAWSNSQLKDYQAYMDILGTHSKVRPLRSLVSEMTTRWVIFHGYAEMKNIEGMSRTLSEIRSLQRKALEISCNK